VYLTQISIVDIWAAISNFSRIFAWGTQLQLPHLLLLHPPALVGCLKIDLRDTKLGVGCLKIDFSDKQHQAWCTLEKG